MQKLCHYQHPPTEDTLVRVYEPTLTHDDYPKYMVNLGFTLGVVHSMGLDKWIMACIHHYSIIQTNFTYLKSSVLCIFISPSLLDLRNH